jgi:hypothetical protein
VSEAPVKAYSGTAVNPTQQQKATPWNPQNLIKTVW